MGHDIEGLIDRDLELALHIVEALINQYLAPIGEQIQDEML